jgi:glycosyltransferase involved in cell wall biosynthesis
VKTIALCMIVRNEAHIIERCLASVLPLIDYILIVDTGSSDGTQEVVRRYLENTGVPGEVVEEAWRDFAYNRSFALAKLREKPTIDYSLMIDADQVVNFDDGFDVVKFKAELDCDIYDLKVTTGSVAYFLPQLASNKIEVVYRGVLHEFRECPEGCSRVIAQGLEIKEIHDSARGQDAAKYQKDAAVLERALAVEKDPFLIARYRFYLAQCYRDAGQSELALKNYLERAELGFWDEEIFYSLYSAAKLMESLNYPEEEIVEAYRRAWRVCPKRIEAIHGLAQFYRKSGRHEPGYQLSRKYLYQPCPTSGLFIESWIFDYGLLDEFSVLAFWAGRYAESLAACARLLNEKKSRRANAFEYVKTLVLQSRSSAKIRAGHPLSISPRMLPCAQYPLSQISRRQFHVLPSRPAGSRLLRLTIKKTGKPWNDACRASERNRFMSIIS